MITPLSDSPDAVVQLSKPMERMLKLSR
jgi:hypothetical protein